VNEMQHIIKPKEQISVAVKHAEIQLEEDRVLKQASSHLMNACQDICKLVELCYEILVSMWPLWVAYTHVCLIIGGCCPCVRP